MEQHAETKDWAYCRVEGCYNIRKKSTYCPGHAHQKRLGRSFTPLKKQRSTPWEYPVCVFEDCRKWAESADGLCGGHQAQRTRGSDLKPLRVVQWGEEDECRHARCHSPAVIGALCALHHAASADTPRGERVKCSVGVCSNTLPASAPSGLCKGHMLLATRYGLGPAALVELFDDYSCQICGSSGPRLHIDHDHSCCPGGNGAKCGKCVRGLLCMHCNHLIGNAFERTDLLLAAIAYLDRVNGCDLRLVA